MLEKMILAKPRGFCAGVDRALTILDVLLETAPDETLYVWHEIVHNETVLKHYRQRGVVFTEDLEQVPEGATLVMSAHGVSPHLMATAQKKAQVIDATCPLVAKVHSEVLRHSRQHRECVLIGHADHVEVKGTRAHYTSEQGALYVIGSVEEAEQLKVKQPENLAYVTQTTLSVRETRDIINALRNQYPQLQEPVKEDICYATSNRQAAVEALCEQAEMIWVFGSPTSSNAVRLKELAEHLGKPAILIEDLEAIQPSMHQPYRVIGVTSGASTPEWHIQALQRWLAQTYPQAILEDLEAIQETMFFALPKSLRSQDPRRSENAITST